MTLIVGTIHGEILPRVMFAPPGSRVAAAPGLPGRMARTILAASRPDRPVRPRLLPRAT